ncbi:MAG: virulence factor Mce family protein [Marmoricola sp.]|nr:virulence factor Mce family protein [Marmoricola sp.]
MYVNITHDTKAEHRRLFLTGIVFMTVMALLVALSIAIYEKAFQSVTMVTVKADRAGLQLAQFGDVRLHGALVGQVRGISQDGKHASIKIGLKPSSAKSIPENIKVEILPTTLFGQKYVALVDPEDPSSKALRDGDVIPTSRVTTNVELSTILANLFPLLRSIRPADLSATLYAIANALRGKGEKIGNTLVELDDYLTDINVHLPTLQKDLTLLASVSRTYSIAAPDLIRLLRNATTTARTVSSKETQLHGFFQDVTGLGKTSTRVLKTNEQAIVTEAALARPLLKLLDTYSPEFKCLLQGSARYSKNLGQIFESGRVAQTMNFNAKQRRPYNASDKPEYGETGHGPWCLGLPYPQVPIGPSPLKDGSDLDNPGAQ